MSKRRECAACPRRRTLQRTVTLYPAVLTRPWEGDFRNLHYFDFRSGQLGRKISDKLFAAKKINSQQVESWLSRMVETPLGNIRSRLAAADPRALDDWPFFRAATLMLWLQGMRIESVTGIEARRSIDQLSKMTEEEVDQLVALIRDQYDLHIIFYYCRRMPHSAYSVSFYGSLQIRPCGFMLPKWARNRSGHPSSTRLRTSSHPTKSEFSNRSSSDERSHRYCLSRNIRGIESRNRPRSLHSADRARTSEDTSTAPTPQQ